MPTWVLLVPQYHKYNKQCKDVMLVTNKSVTHYIHAIFLLRIWCGYIPQKIHIETPLVNTCILQFENNDIVMKPHSNTIPINRIHKQEGWMDGMGSQGERSPHVSLMSPRLPQGFTMML